MVLNNYFEALVNERPRAKLWLLKPNFQRIERLTHITELSGTFKVSNLNSIQFSVPPTIQDEQTKEYITNPVYNLMKNKYIIQYEYNGFKDYLVIDNISKQSNESDKLVVTAESLATELNKKTVGKIEFLASTIQDMMTKVLALHAPLWKVGIIDDKLKNVKRELQSDQSTVTSVIDEINILFDSVVVFDNKNRTISFLHKDNVGYNRGLKINESNYLKSFEDSIVSKDVLTRLYLYGKEGLTINGVNPAGTEYIEDFSYFIHPFKRNEKKEVISHSNYMSDELCHALLDYEDYFNSKKEEAETLTKDYENLLNEQAPQDLKLRELTALTQRLQDRVDLLKPKGEYIDFGLNNEKFYVNLEQSSYYILMLKNTGTLTNVKFQGKTFNLPNNEWTYIKIDTKDITDATKYNNQLKYSVNLTGVSPQIYAVLSRSSLSDYEETDNKKIEEKYNYVKAKEDMEYQTGIVNTLNKRLSDLEKQKQSLIASMNPKTYLSDKLYRERELFIYSGTWSEENHTDAKALLEDGIKHLKNQIKLNREITIDIVNFVQSLEDQHNWSKLKVGDIVVFSNKIFGEKIKSYIIEMQINHESNEITLTLSDVIDFKDINTIISERLASTVSTSNQVDLHKNQIRNQDEKLQRLNGLLDGEWDANDKRVIAGGRTVEIGKQGIKNLSETNPDRRIEMINGVISSTKNDGNSYEILADSNGLKADSLKGKVKLDEVTVENEDNSIVIQEDGLYIREDKFKLLDENGINYFAKNKKEIEDKFIEFQKIYDQKLNQVVDESKDVSNALNETNSVLMESFKDEIVTDVEKEKIKLVLSQLEKENTEYVQQIELALNSAYINNDDLARLQLAYQEYTNMYENLVNTINESIADSRVTQEENKKVSDSVVRFRQEVKDILLIVEEVLENIRDNQVDNKIISVRNYIDRISEDITDEMADVQEAFNQLSSSISNAIQDGIVNATEKINIENDLIRLKSEQMNIENRFNTISNNPDLSAEQKQILTDTYNEYKSKFDTYTTQIEAMISDGSSTPEEITDYQNNFNAMEEARQNYVSEYDNSIFDISKSIKDVALGAIEGLREEYKNDLKDFNDAFSSYQTEIGLAIDDGVITAEERARLKTHNDIVDREYKDLEDNYNDIISNPSLPSSNIQALTSNQSVFIQAYNNLKENFNIYISNDEVSSEEKQLINTLLTDYKIAYTNYNTSIQQALQELTKKAQTTANKAVTVLDVVTDGFTVTSETNGDKSIATLDPDSIKLNSNLIELGDGDITISKGISKIKYAVINDAHVDKLTMNKLTGGELNIGGYTYGYKTDSQGNIVYETSYDEEGNETTSAVIDENKKVTVPAGEINFRDEENNVLFQISSENKGADQFTVQDLIVENKIQNDYIASKSTDGMAIEVLGLDAGENDVGYNDEKNIYKTRTINEAIDLLPDILGTGFFIDVLPSYASADPSEHIILKSKLGGGYLDINFNGITSTARFSIDGCQCRIAVKNGNFNVLDDEKNYMIQNYYSHYVTFENLSFNGNNAPDLKGINCYGGGNTFITNCDIQNVTDCVSASYLNSVYMFNNTGQGTRYGAIAWRGSNININGKAPLGKANDASTSYAGNINTTDATYPEPTVVKPPTKVSTTKTKTFKTSKANHFRYSGYNSWARSGNHHYGYPVQGQGYGSPLQVGIWWNLEDSSGNSMRSVLSGKAIKSIKVKLTRRSKIGKTSNVKFNLRMHKYSSQPSGRPSFSSSSKEIILDWSESKTVDVTSTFKSLINQNTYAGFGIKATTNDLAHYGELSKYLEVTVVYV